MTYHVTHWTGESERDLPLERLSELLDELAEADDEHPDVSLTHESEWCLSMGRAGQVTFENLEEGGPRHLLSVSRESRIELLRMLARGQIGALLALDWFPGYPRAT
ncbi:MAG: hypothetical protein AAF533_15905 [Acidobacteriota bacterium]